MKVVLDSNILISVLNVNDSHHVGAADLISQLNAGCFEILAPVIYLWEMDAYLGHPGNAKTHAQDTTATFKVSTIDVTSGLYTRTYSNAKACVKGADRVFISLAKDPNAPLITNDEQIIGNATVFGVRAVSVSDFLAGNPDKSYMDSLANRDRNR